MEEVVDPRVWSESVEAIALCCFVWLSLKVRLSPSESVGWTPKRKLSHMPYVICHVGTKRKPRSTDSPPLWFQPYPTKKVFSCSVPDTCRIYRVWGDTQTVGAISSPGCCTTRLPGQSVVVC